jgi:hypothetical protein
MTDNGMTARERAAEQTEIRRPLENDSGARDGIVAPLHTKRGLAKWRGEVVHPGGGRIPYITAQIRRGAEGFTCTKEMVKLTHVRAGKNGACAHFRVCDPDYLSRIHGAYPEFHHAAVRVLANYLMDSGYDGLRRVCYGNRLPDKPFVVGSVQRERVIRVGDVVYRPDIVVENAEPGYARIELEVVNLHGPSEERLVAARRENAIVLWMSIRDLVEKFMSDDRQVLVPDDSTLLAELLRLWFTCPNEDRAAFEIAHRRWRDLDQAAYMRLLREGLRTIETQIHNVGEAIACVLRSTDLRDFDDMFAGPPSLARVRRQMLQVERPANKREIEAILAAYDGATSIPDTIGAALADLRAAYDAVFAAVPQLENGAVQVLARWQAQFDAQERAEAVVRQEAIAARRALEETELERKREAERAEKAEMARKREAERAEMARLSALRRDAARAADAEARKRRAAEHAAIRDALIACAEQNLPRVREARKNLDRDSAWSVAWDARCALLRIAQLNPLEESGDNALVAALIEETRRSFIDAHFC